MNTPKLHTFHIPVMGLCYTIDTPIKIARFGISSVVSIIEDDLVEKMRSHYYKKIGEPFSEISKEDPDYRAKRITDYLNLMKRIVDDQTAELRNLTFNEGSDLVKYFTLLPSNSPVRIMFEEMKRTENSFAKEFIQKQLRKIVNAGSIDVNIMSKVDRNTYSKSGEMLPMAFSDAISALRGYALSNLNSSIIFSAGYNPRLYSYLENFPDFFPEENGTIKKRIVLKVSDFRSAQIQGKILAKKGIWISEYRIESGLNCGGHAFATEGLLLGPILEEFKLKKNALVQELLDICNPIWINKGIIKSNLKLSVDVSAQGGIGTANEDQFLREHYQISSIGWGSPFLLVPESTNVDEETLLALTNAKKEDYYLSHQSPLGIPFNSFRNSSSNKQRLERIQKGKPGSPCYKKFLSTNTEFTEKPICTASREYQKLKIEELNNKQLDNITHDIAFEKIVEKDCLCEGLGAAVLIKNNLKLSHKLTAVSICPGPNLAYFSKISSLHEMVDHIYGRLNVLNSVYRSNFFINELNIYCDYLKKEISNISETITSNQTKYLERFKLNLLEGITYYKNLIPSLKLETEKYTSKMKEELNTIENAIKILRIPEPHFA